MVESCRFARPLLAIVAFSLRDRRAIQAEQPDAAGCTANHRLKLRRRLAVERLPHVPADGRRD